MPRRNNQNSPILTEGLVPLFFIYSLLGKIGVRALAGVSDPHLIQFAQYLQVVKPQPWNRPLDGS